MTAKPKTKHPPLKVVLEVRVSPEELGRRLNKLVAPRLPEKGKEAA